MEINVACAEPRHARHGEIRPSHYLGARVGRLAAAGMRPWYGAPRAFEMALGRVIHPPGHFRLALHPLWANACLGPLEGPLPPRSLHHELADWVCGQGR